MKANIVQAIFSGLVVLAAIYAMGCSNMSLDRQVAYQIIKQGVK